MLDTLLGFLLNNIGRVFALFADFWPRLDDFLAGWHPNARQLSTDHFGPLVHLAFNAFAPLVDLAQNLYSRILYLHERLFNPLRDLGETLYSVLNLIARERWPQLDGLTGYLFYGIQQLTGDYFTPLVTLAGAVGNLTKLGVIDFPWLQRLIGTGERVFQIVDNFNPKTIDFLEVEIRKLASGVYPTLLVVNDLVDAKIATHDQWVIQREQDIAAVLKGMIVDAYKGDLDPILKKRLLALLQADVNELILLADDTYNRLLGYMVAAWPDVLTEAIIMTYGEST